MKIEPPKPIVMHINFHKIGKKKVTENEKGK